MKRERILKFIGIDDWQYKKMVLEGHDESFAGAACKSLTQIGIDSVPIKRDSLDYVLGRRGATVISNLAVNLENLDVIQFYSIVEKTGGGPGGDSKTTFYRVDYIVKADINRLRRGIKGLDACIEYKWRGHMLFRPGKVELQDIKWIPASQTGSAVFAFKKLFRVGLNSRLTDALNNDITLKDFLIQESKEQWLYRWALAVVCEGIKIVGDRRNGCVRITTPPDDTLDERELLDILPSRELMQALDKIAAHIKSAW